MNIFVLDLDHQKCARYHVDKHVVKMITESAQILSTVQHLVGNENVPYKPTHKNHPCTKWCAASRENYVWLVELAKAIYHEYKFRYNKQHKSGEIILAHLTNPPISLPSIGMTPFAQAMPEIYKGNDAINSYRNYYKNEKQHIASWKNREKPYWW